MIGEGVEDACASQDVKPIQQVRKRSQHSTLPLTTHPMSMMLFASNMKAAKAYAAFDFPHA